MAELSQEKLEELVVGKQPPPQVVFYDKALLDVEASKAAGRRIYKNHVMVKKTHPGVTDWVSERASKKDILSNPREYEIYLRSRGGIRSPSIDIVTGISPMEIQELIDYGIQNIDDLVAAKVLPHHLTHLQSRAKKIQSALKGEDHAKEENVGEGSVNNSITALAKSIAGGGQVHADSVLGSEPAGGTGEHRREAEEGLRPGGQQHGNQGLNASFELTMVYR